jgi:hypothetical protein
MGEKLSDWGFSRKIETCVKKDERDERALRGQSANSVGLF